MMLDNTSYNKIKLTQELSQMIWFIDKHGLMDAEKAGDSECVDILAGMRKDLEKHLEKLQKNMCIISQ